MKYQEVCRGIFQKRPNRFIAEVELEGRRGDLPCEEYRSVAGSFWFPALWFIWKKVKIRPG